MSRLRLLLGPLCLLLGGCLSPFAAHYVPSPSSVAASGTWVPLESGTWPVLVETRDPLPAERRLRRKGWICLGRSRFTSEWIGLQGASRQGVAVGATRVVIATRVVAEAGGITWSWIPDEEGSWEPPVYDPGHRGDSRDGSGRDDHEYEAPSVYGGGYQEPGRVAVDTATMHEYRVSYWAPPAPARR